ncbi:MAG: AI-2E family transporter [Rhodocyclales bacterium]|nr:AI-2E family transporter [Rhodocyclales bacterium]
MLWLVVPFLLALILYYVLQPLTQYCVYRGLGRDAAAAWTMLLFLVALAVASLFMVPWIATHLVDIQASVEPYLLGGLHLLESSLRALEAGWPVLANAHLAESAMLKFQNAAGNASEHVEAVAMGIAAWMPSLLLAPFLAFFFLKDGMRFKRFLAHAVPNAFFEKTLYLLHEVDQTLRAYFTGLMKLTVLDTLTLAAGLWMLGFPAALALGLICAVLAWIPYVGSILGGLLVVLVAATDFPAAPAMAYWAVGLFIVARLLDDFVYMPLTVGKSLHMHPLVTVLMIFAGGAVAGISGLMLVLPLLGVVMVCGETVGKVVTDPRLMARHRHAQALRRRQASADLAL